MKDDNKKEKTKTLLISVGGAPEPIIKSIELNNPEGIIFFVSRSSYNSVSEKILPAVMDICKRIPPHEIVVSPDEQDIGESSFALLKEVPVAMKKLGREWQWPETCDLTGGTKPMSAALVWASSRFPCIFSYIGSDSPQSRTKGGLGIVINGHERCMLRENPWNAIAYYDVKQAVTLFNGGQYANAVLSLNATLERVSDPQRKRLLNLICGIWKGYEFWDAFNHKNAIKEFSKHIQSFVDVAQTEEPIWPGLTEFAEKTTKCFAELKNLPTNKPEQLSWAKINDLLANALRRGDFEGKYDDATARCYAAIEKYGKHALKLNHGIDNSNCRLEQLPDELVEEYKRKYSSGENEDHLQFGMQATYKILIHLADPIGTRFCEIKKDLDKVLPLRNASILGHGFVPIKKSGFDDIFRVALTLMKLEKKDLTAFPEIKVV